MVKPPPAVNTDLPDRIESDPEDPYIIMLLLPYHSEQLMTKVTSFLSDSDSESFPARRILCASSAAWLQKGSTGRNRPLIYKFIIRYSSVILPQRYFWRHYDLDPLCFHMPGIYMSGQKVLAPCGCIRSWNRSLTMGSTWTPYKQPFRSRQPCRPAGSGRFRTHYHGRIFPD